MYKSNRRWSRSVYSLLGFIGRKFPTINEGLFSLGDTIKPRGRVHLHVIGVTTNSEGEAASDLRIVRLHVGVLQRTAGQHGFLRVVKGYRAELLPVADEVVLDNDLMDS